MKPSDILRSVLSAAKPDPSWSPQLKALYHAKKGHWNAAHELVQDGEDKLSFWIHAHLHREEGDHPNAAYWYRRAGQVVCEGSLQEEWTQLAEHALESGG